MVLAAGEGLRMRPLTEDTPKPLLKVQGEPLLAHQINLLKSQVSSIAVTVGYMSEKVSSFALQNGADYVINNIGGGNASWLNRSMFRQCNFQILVITCDNLMSVDLADIEAESRIKPRLSYLISRTSGPGIKGDRIHQTFSRVNAISQEESVDSLATGLQVINPGTLSTNRRFETFHDVWNDLIGSDLLFESRNHPTEWAAIDTPEDLMAANVAKK